MSDTPKRAKNLTWITSHKEDASLMMMVMTMMILMMPFVESDKRLEWLLVFMSEGNLN